MKIFWPIHQRRTGPNPSPPRAATPAPGAAESEQARYDRAWADYVEWSGLDDDGLHGGPPRSQG